MRREGGGTGTGVNVRSARRRSRRRHPRARRCFLNLGGAPPSRFLFRLPFSRNAPAALRPRRFFRHGPPPVTQIPTPDVFAPRGGILSQIRGIYEIKKPSSRGVACAGWTWGVCFPSAGPTLHGSPPPAG